MKQDEYGCVINDAENYAHIARLSKTTVAFLWTDGQGSALDIVLSRPSGQFGIMNCGVFASGALIVSVFRLGAFGFAPKPDKLYPEYVGEKLGMQAESVTTEALTELINGVMAEIWPA